MFHILIFVLLNVHTPVVENAMAIVTSNTNVNEKKYPSFGACWTSAMRSLKTGCDNLNLESQKFMALRFTDCFLVVSGDEAYGCDRLLHSEEKNRCIKNMSTRDYNTFTDFFTHVDNLCRFLEIQVWQEDTETKVGSLLASSTKARVLLLEALQKQKISLQLQKMSNLEQMQILQATNRLDERLFELQSKTEQTVDNFSKSSSSSYGILMETFTGLSSLRQWLANKTSWLETTIFYVCGIIVILLLTSLPELEEAKWVLFSLLMVAACIECGLWSVSLYPDAWLARNALVYICAGVLCFSAYHYRETESASHTIMLEIERNIDHLEELMLGARLSNEHAQFSQNAEVSSSVDRMSITPDKTSVGCDDNSWQSVRLSVTPERTSDIWQRDNDKTMRSSSWLSITPDRVGTEDGVHQQRNVSTLLQNPHTRVCRRPVEALHVTRRTRYAGSQSTT